MLPQNALGDIRGNSNKANKDNDIVFSVHYEKTSIPSKKDWALSRGLMIWGMTVNEKQRSDNTGFCRKVLFFLKWNGLL